MNNLTEKLWKSSDVVVLKLIELLAQKELLVRRISRQLVCLHAGCLSLWPRESVEREYLLSMGFSFASMVDNSGVRLVDVRSRRHDERTMEFMCETQKQRYCQNDPKHERRIILIS